MKLRLRPKQYHEGTLKFHQFGCLVPVESPNCEIEVTFTTVAAHQHVSFNSKADRTVSLQSARTFESGCHEHEPEFLGFDLNTLAAVPTQDFEKLNLEIDAAEADFDIPPRT